MLLTLISGSYPFHSFLSEGLKTLFHEHVVAEPPPCSILNETKFERELVEDYLLYSEICVI